MTATKCPECGEELTSHAGRGWKYFHQWAHGPYDGSSSGKCSLDGLAFEQDGTPIAGSDSMRAAMVYDMHGHKYTTARLGELEALIEKRYDIVERQVGIDA